MLTSVTITVRAIFNPEKEDDLLGLSENVSNPANIC